MLSFLRRYKQSLIITTFLIFLIGIFVGLGGYLFTDTDTTAAVAKVGSTKIPYFRYRVRVNQYLDTLRAQGRQVTPEITKRIKQEMLRDMIVNEILAQQADKMGLFVSDRELSLAIQNNPMFKDQQGRFNQEAYFQVVRAAFNTTPEQFEKIQRRSMLSAKLKGLMLRGSKLMPGEIREEYLRAKGSIKNFEAEKGAFANQLQQERALDAINFFLRQLSTQLEVRSFLAEREPGL